MINHHTCPVYILLILTRCFSISTLTSLRSNVEKCKLITRQSNLYKFILITTQDYISPLLRENSQLNEQLKLDVTFLP